MFCYKISDLTLNWYTLFLFFFGFFFGGGSEINCYSWQLFIIIATRLQYINVKTLTLNWFLCVTVLKSWLITANTLYWQLGCNINHNKKKKKKCACKWSYNSIELFQSTEHSKQFTTLDTFNNSHKHSYIDGRDYRAKCWPTHLKQIWGSVAWSAILQHAARGS